MEKIIIMVTILISFSCSGKIIDNHKTINSGELIYGSWILKNSLNKKNVGNNMPIGNSYECILISHTYKKKKINNELAKIQNIAWDIRIIEIIGKFPEYKLKFKYNESETIDNEGNIIADWLDGEMIMHFINEDEVWFELVYVQRGERNKTWIFDDLIKYGKDNVYKREK